MRFILQYTVALFTMLSMKSPSQEASFNVTTKGVQTFDTEDKVGRNQVVFVSKAPFEDIFGAATDVRGKISFDPANIQKTIKGEIIVNAKSMKTGLKQRDQDMLGERWLDVGKYQTIRFKLKELSDTKLIRENHIEGTATGDFTMHGVTRTISVPISISYFEESPETIKRAPGDLLAVRSKFSVLFADYHVEGIKNLLRARVSKSIDLDINIFATNNASADDDTSER